MPNESTPPPSNELSTKPGDAGVALYTSEHEGLRALRESYDRWNARLAESSLTLSFAVIGANWAVFSSLNQILENPWAQASVAIIVFSFGLNLLAVKMMCERFRAQAQHAQHKDTNWRKEFEDSRGDPEHPWPYTKEIDRLGDMLRWCRTWLPILGGLLFLIALKW